MSATECAAEQSAKSNTRPYRALTSLRTSANDPLAGLPSILALRDLRRRMDHARLESPSLPDLHLRLRLAPPSVLRARRAIQAPVFGSQTGPWTVGRIAELLTPTLLQHALETPPLDVAGTQRLRQLWLHAIAAARAAEHLAKVSGIADPEEAYLCGLLHDLPLWLDAMSRRVDGHGLRGDLRDWATRLRLPPALALPLTALADREAAAVPGMPSLLQAAELLAEAAGFNHPGEPPTRQSATLADQGLCALGSVERLREIVAEDLRAVGLDLDVEEPSTPPSEPGSLFEGAGWRSPDAAQIALQLLGDERAVRYRNLLQTVANAGLRRLGFDRAVLARWQPERGELRIRLYSDRSARAPAADRLAASDTERALLADCLQQGRPVRLAAATGVPGIAEALGAEEVLAVPLHRGFATPTILLLDRTLTARPLQLLRESDLVQTLASVSAMRIENLLLQRRSERSRKFAMTDPLTRLWNRRVGIASLDQAIARAHRSGSPLTVQMIDLDEFKKLNDTSGHLQGDAALRAASDVLRKTLRRSDTICRYGGEEFLVVLDETRAEEAAVLAARLFLAVEARGKDERLPITVSIGQASLRPDDTAESLLHRADYALYASKSQGRNRFSIDDEHE